MTKIRFQPAVIVEASLIIIYDIISLIIRSYPEIVPRILEHTVYLHIRYGERETFFRLMYERTFCLVIQEQSVLFRIEEDGRISVRIYI